MNPTLIIRITVIVLIAVCWISAFVLFWKKPGDAVLAGFGCVVLIAFIAEHINNYFVWRKKMKFNFIFSIIGLLLLSLFCGCDTPGALNATAIHRTDVLVKKIFNGEKITRKEGSFIWGTELEDTLTPKNEKYSAVGEKVSAAIAPIFKQDNVSGFLIESYYADSCHVVKFEKDKKITMDGPYNSRLVCVQIHFTPPGKVGRKSYTLAIPVDTFVEQETLMITDATLNGKLLIPQQILEQMLKIK